jgi:dipeptidyl aminopeptidase/acylaminoacyl peptidase
MDLRKLLILLLSVPFLFSALDAADKPKLTLDEFFNSVGFSTVKISADGQSVVIGTGRADWNQNIFRKDLWLYRDDGRGGGSLVPLTQSGHDTEPQWSPDGRWIAFLSDRKAPSRSKRSEEDDSTDKGKEDTNQLYLISSTGGEAFALTRGEEEIHAFAWSSDSRVLYFATRAPWNKEQKDEYKKQWKDVSQYRAAERGDVIFSLNLADGLAGEANAGTRETPDREKESDATPGSRALANSPWRVEQISVSPDGNQLAFVTESVSERQEKVDQFEIYSIDLAAASEERPARRLTQNEAVEKDLDWAPDNRHIFFSVEIGDVAGPYRDLQPHLYWLDAATGQIEQWAKDFVGSVNHYAVAGDHVLVAGRLGTEVSAYSMAAPSKSLARLNSWSGTYENISTAEHSSRIAFIYSAFERPTEVYLAESAGKLQEAKAITRFNQLFLERRLPQAKPYRWKADDGATVEGMLVYPPGKFEAQNLPTFVLIHGGPADADGNHFEADWYQWDRLAATAGWLVFEPNYRGSTGYGDKFLMEIVPQIVSRPGKDILEGVDALMKDGIADPNQLAIGGYSYGGYMTNWLITQTTRFKAAVTGAGAVEHVANWGNDDTTFDDAYFLGGLPWEASERYHDEAAIYYINRVKTPTHLVAGANDIRVAVAEDYLLDHALHNLGVPSTLLVFPGEGHSLSKNPWHGKIKVREELKWLEKYGRIPSP